MNFVSTRDHTHIVTAAEAILRGLAPDGGLYVPTDYPRFTPEQISAMQELSYAALAAEVITPYLPGFTKEEVLTFTEAAYAPFRNPAVAPLHRLDDSTHVLELYHGPTCAFKDFALQMLPRLIPASVRKTGGKDTVAILVATSGDTGKAALEGFADVEGVKIGVFYPHGGVSEIQRLQMATQTGNNVNVFAIEGNFDDAQTGVKNIFGDADMADALKEKGIVLSSANSINWGRLAPQIAYYFAAYAQLLKNGTIKPGDPVDFSVPTGNFGDILAGWFAKKSGLPVGKLICASNKNNILTDFLGSGIYDRRRDFHLTMSPSMDILISSNLERLLYLLTGDSAQVAAWMAELKQEGRYTITAELLEKMAQEGFLAFCADEAETAKVIRSTFDTYDYALDPHTAVGLSALQQYRAKANENRVSVVLSTASPFKFAEAMLHCLQQPVPEEGFAQLDALEGYIAQKAPAPLADLRQKPVRFDRVIAKETMPQAVLDWLTR
ncbi:MAG: threonine synthase [Clostridia bacterium]|nr:threonine synthase [Clostridia bacterium]